MIYLFVLTQLTNVTDTRTHTQTDTAWRHRPRLCKASRGKNLNSSCTPVQVRVPTTTSLLNCHKHISVHKKSKLTLRGPWVRLRQLKQVKTSSSAVANRLRDASCLLVVSFVASIIQYLERSFFIISYFGFRFTSAYNLIQFCGLRRNVEPCCHTHDSQSTVIVYSARARLVGLAL